jgi:hypothetical protein
MAKVHHIYGRSQERDHLSVSGGRGTMIERPPDDE